MADPATITEIDRLVANGTIVGGKYRVVRKVGAGAMGVVVAAEHIELGESIALKILNPELRGNREALARFMREARAMFALKSPHVGRVFDVGKLDSGEPFIVMELLAGLTLKEMLEKTPRPPLEDSITLMKQIAEAVGEAHSLDIVHRDLKPENIFVSTREGAPFAKVIDFGVSKTRLGASAEPTLTSVDSMLGTPRFMAPEQFLNSQTADARSDVWSLGVIFYRMITGKFPFEAKDAADLLTQIRTKRPKLPHEVATDVRTEVSAIAMRCLAQRPQERYAHARELGAALADLATRTSAPPFQKEQSAATIVRKPEPVIALRGVEAPLDDPTTPHKRGDMPFPAKNKLKTKAELDEEALDQWHPPASRQGSFTDELTQKTPRGVEFFDVDTLSDPARARVDEPSVSAEETFEVDTMVGPASPSNAKAAVPPDDTTTKRRAVSEATAINAATRVSSPAPIPRRADPFSETRRFPGAPAPIPVAAISASTLPLSRDSYVPRAQSGWSAVAIAIAIGAAVSTLAMVALVRYRQHAHELQADTTHVESASTAPTATSAPSMPMTAARSPNVVNQGTLTIPTSTSTSTSTSPTSEPTHSPTWRPRPRSTAGANGKGGPNDPNW